MFLEFQNHENSTSIVEDQTYNFSLVLSQVNEMKSVEDKTWNIFFKVKLGTSA